MDCMMFRLADSTRARAIAITAVAGVAVLLSLEPRLSSQGAPRLFPSAKRPLEANAYLPPAPSTTPWAPAWSPDGKWIAVGLAGSLWKIDWKTQVAYELTYAPKYHASPSWSPDGRWIIYTADDGGKTIQLEILNVETGATRALTDDASIYTDPAFSPDGSQ